MIVQNTVSRADTRTLEVKPNSPVFISKYSQSKGYARSYTSGSTFFFPILPLLQANNSLMLGQTNVQFRERFTSTRAGKEYRQEKETQWRRLHTSVKTLRLKYRFNLQLMIKDKRNKNTLICAQHFRLSMATP